MDGGGGGEVEEELARAVDAGVVHGDDEVAGLDLADGESSGGHAGHDDAIEAALALGRFEVADLDAEGLEDLVGVSGAALLRGGGRWGRNGTELGDYRLEPESLAISPDVELEGLADAGALDERDELPARADFFAIHDLNDIAILEPGDLGRGAGLGAEHSDSALFAVAEDGADGGIDIADLLDAEESADGAAALEDLEKGVFDVVRRD